MCLPPHDAQQAPSTALRSPWVSPDVSCCLRGPLSPQSSPWGLDRSPLPPARVGTPQLVQQWRLGLISSSVDRSSCFQSTWAPSSTKEHLVSGRGCYRAHPALRHSLESSPSAAGPPGPIRHGPATKRG